MLHTEFHAVLSEKVTENILGALFTKVLGWPTRDLYWQFGFADLLIASGQCKHMVLETKKPGKFARVSEVYKALRQVYRYATEQGVEQAAITDGFLFFQMVLDSGVWVPRLAFRMDSPDTPAEPLRLLTPSGIHKKGPRGIGGPILSRLGFGSVAAELPEGVSRHPQYALPAHCFAFVGEYGNPRTWRFPYRHPDGSPDEVRLPRAIYAAITGWRRGTLPAEAVAGIVARLSRAVWETGKGPAPGIQTAPVYHALAEFARQLQIPGDSEYSACTDMRR